MSSPKNSKLVFFRGAATVVVMGEDDGVSVVIARLSFHDVPSHADVVY